MKIATFPLLLLITSAKCWNLTESENQMRLRNCGRQMLETPPFPNNTNIPISIDYPQNGFIVTVMLSFIPTFGGNREIIEDRALGMFISPRHILTSSHPVMDALKQWVGVWKEESEEAYVQVPLAAMRNHSQNFTLIIRLESATNETPGVDFYAEEAWIDYRYRDDVRHMKSPMIITLKRNHPNMKYPCLAKNSTFLNVTQMMHIYGLNENNQSALDYRFLSITEFAKDKRWIHTEGYGEYYDKGGPMIAIIDGKVTIVGMAAYTTRQYFYDLRALDKQICHLSGACNLEDHEIWNTTTMTPNSTTMTSSPGRRIQRPMENGTGAVLGEEEEDLDDVFYSDGADVYEVAGDFLKKGGRQFGGNLNFFGAVLMIGGSIMKMEHW